MPTTRENRHILQAATVLLVVVLIVVASVSYQVQRRNSAIDRIDESSQEAKDAAIEARRVLKAAVDQSRNGAVNQQAVQDAFDSIHRIEDKVDAIQEQINNQK